MTSLCPHNVDYSKSTFSGLPKISQFVNYSSMGNKRSEPGQYAEIGDRLEAIRKVFSDLNQKDWAEKHHFGHSTYNNWVTGIRRIPVESAEALCDLYGVDLDFIYRGRRDGLPDNLKKVL
ncbi:Helix-turn-helix domain protein [Ketogulonicigenium vulgare WSH-001]|uniref:Helix-turn-helix domain protein n=2 Tax=Ketogulonicigenium vulgare TaxID=92945 RepID=F9YA21_KETVW|nr:Helix-turn-helix domain protein [Ketogulonicigenium vulgare WSH-001]